jgi:hypothetical protein
MSWLEAVMDDRPVRAVFGGDAPSSRSVVVHSITLHRDGPRAVLTFDLADYPSAPPQKWAAQGFGVVQVRLVLSGVESVRLDGWDVDVVGDLTLDRDGDRVDVALRSPVATFSCTAAAAYVENVSAYATE